MLQHPTDHPFDALSARALFLVWGPPSHGPRSRVFARALGIGSLHYVYRTMRRGALAAPLKYGYQALETVRRLQRERPQVIFVQSPPSLAVLVVALYCRATGACFLVDAHSDAMLRRVWRWPGWLHRALARRAVATVVTNEHFAAELRSWGARALVLPDIPTTFEVGPAYPVQGRLNVAVVSSFAPDEPLAEVLAAAHELPEVHFYVTGRRSRVAPELVAQAPANVHWTDFLPDPAYYGLLGAVQAVLCLTTRDHTMQRGACEALSLGQPLLTSDWPLLRSYFAQGTVHVDNSREGIREGIRTLLAAPERFRQEMVALRARRRQEWQERVAELARLVQETLDGPPAGGSPWSEPARHESAGTIHSEFS